MRAPISLEDRFEQVLAEFLQAEERGEHPNPSELLRANPELETSLREYFRDRDRFDRMPLTPRPRGVPPQPEPAVSHFGSYAALEPLGQGGRGIVYRVSDPELNRPLAVKVLRPELRDEAGAVRRFLEEAQVMGQLQHPGIVPVHAAGCLPDGRPYFVMKLIQGRTLAELLALRPAPAHDLPRFLVIFQQVCQTVAYAHSRRVIHRDLKPANIMVGAFAEVLVMDWGLAKVLPADMAGQGNPRGEPEVLAAGAHDTVRTLRTETSGSSSADGLVVGTFAYMAPEQAKGQVEELDPRTDVFGLGAVLCEVLTGLPPYAGVPGWERRVQAESGDLAEAFGRLERCGADAELIMLARDCLAPERERRPRDAAAVAERIAAYLAEAQERLRRAELEGAAAQARAEEARATVQAERRARRLTVGLGVAVLAVLASLTVGGLWLQRQQAEKTRQTEALRQDVATMLAQAIHFRQGAHFEESRELLEQAQRRLGTDRPAELLKQVEQALADTGLARRLDAARYRGLTIVEGRRLDLAGTEQEYAAALRAAGLGEQGEDAEVVAARVRASAVRAELVTALDNWAALTRDRSRQAWLLAVVRAIDPDPERDRLRQPALWRDGAALARLLEQSRVAALSPQLAAALGQAQLMNGEDAVPLLREALPHYPHDFWLNFNMAVALSQTKQLDEATGYYRAALALRPRASVVHNNFGDVLRERGRLDEAIRYLEEAVRIDPKFTDAHYNLGLALYARGRRDEAIGHFEEVLRTNPKDAPAHNNLGHALYAMGGHRDEAISHYEEALRINPKYATAHNNLGAALADKHRLDEAIGHFLEALRINPRYAEAHNNLGAALCDKGQWDEGVGHYKEALRIDPKNATAAHCNIGDALREKGRLDEAIRHYKEALQIDPKNARAHNNLGIALCTKDQLDEGIRHFEQVLQIDPKDAEAHFNLGLALYARGRRDEAIGHYKDALRINPKYAEAHYNLGLALSAKARQDEAVGHYKEALRIDPTNAQAHGALGQALLELGRFADARDATRRCLDLLPQHHPMRDVVMQQLRRCEAALQKQAREGK
jgi:tetratricopeptide (TPR) repeat protein